MLLNDTAKLIHIINLMNVYNTDVSIFMELVNDALIKAQIKEGPQSNLLYLTYCSYIHFCLTKGNWHIIRNNRNYTLEYQNISERQHKQRSTHNEMIFPYNVNVINLYYNLQWLYLKCITEKNRLHLTTLCTCQLTKPHSNYIYLFICDSLGIKYNSISVFFHILQCSNVIIVLFCIMPHMVINCFN